jgi:hypothetical protein
MQNEPSDEADDAEPSVVLSSTDCGLAVVDPSDDIDKDSTAPATSLSFNSHREKSMGHQCAHVALLVDRQ